MIIFNNIIIITIFLCLYGVFKSALIEEARNDSRTLCIIQLSVIVMNSEQCKPKFLKGKKAYATHCFRNVKRIPYPVTLK